jgi:hypothetical protein
MMGECKLHIGVIQHSSSIQVASLPICRQPSWLAAFNYCISSQTTLSIMQQREKSVKKKAILFPGVNAGTAASGWPASPHGAV